MIRPETQTFVSTTTRRSNLGHSRRDVALDARRGRIHAAGDAHPSIEERIEAPLPLVCGNLPDAVLGQPVVNRLPHESSDRFTAALAHSAQRTELFLIEIDVRADHRLYIIHHESVRSPFPVG